MMKNSLNKISVMCVRYLLAFSIFTQSFAFAFDGPTHIYVVDESAKMLFKMGDDYKKFYKKDVIEKLLKFCEMPDKDETEGVYKNHFYNIATGRNFMDEKTSALSKAKSHYREALVSYKTGNYNKAWEELGRAIHFMEDLVTPVHGGYDCPMDAVNKLSMHVNFEKKCILVQDECHANINDKWLRYFVDNSIEDIGKMCSRLANDNFFSLEKNYVYEEAIAFNSVLNAQRVVVGILYKFFIECQEIRIN